MSWMQRVFGVVCVLAFAVGLTGTASAAPRYPDLRALPPTDLQAENANLGNGVRHWRVKFTTKVLNDGEGPLELHGELELPPDQSTLSGESRASQRIYGDAPGEFTDEQVGTFVFHVSHMHFHFDDHARFELWSRSEFEKALAKGFRKGAPLYTNRKVSFCIFDVEQHDPDASPVGIYQTCSPVMEGLSVGWADVYDSSLADQWVDVGPEMLPDGDYVIRNVVDPSNLLWESDGKADPTREGDLANSGFTYFSVVNGALVAPQDPPPPPLLPVELPPVAGVTEGLG